MTPPTQMPASPLLPSPSPSRQLRLLEVLSPLPSFSCPSLALFLARSLTPFLSSPPMRAAAENRCTSALLRLSAVSE
eukprot:3465255-Rhodomonas_salina.1